MRAGAIGLRSIDINSKVLLFWIITCRHDKIIFFLVERMPSRKNRERMVKLYDSSTKKSRSVPRVTHLPLDETTEALLQSPGDKPCELAQTSLKIDILAAIVAIGLALNSFSRPL